MSKYVTDEAMRSAMTLQKGYIDQGDSNNAEGIDSLKAGKNLLTGVLTGTNWKSSSEAVRNPTLHNIDLLNDGYFIIKEADDIYIVSPLVQVEKGKTYCFSFLMSGGGNFVVDVVGSQNTYSTHSSGGGKVKFSFTPQVTESVYIFVKTTSKKLSQPQLELGSGWSQFTASTEELQKLIGQTSDKVDTLLLSAQYFVAKYSKGTNDYTEISHQGQKDILNKFGFVLLDTTDNTNTTTKARRLKDNNLFRFEDGSFAPTVGITTAQYNQCMANDVYTEESGTYTKVYDAGAFDAAAQWEIDKALIKAGNQAQNLYISDGNGGYQLVTHVLRPWETTETKYTIGIANLVDLYLLDNQVGKSGDYWKGIFLDPIIWDGIDLTKRKLPPTAIGPGPVTTIEEGGKVKTRNFFYLYSGMARCQSNPGELPNHDFYEADRTYPRIGDMQPVRNMQYARNNNADSQKPYPFAEGGYFATNLFITALELAAGTRYIHKADLFGSGITSVESVSEISGFFKNGGVRLKKVSDTNWQYKTLISRSDPLQYSRPGETDYIGSLLTKGYPKEQCMESQMAASMATELGINPTIDPNNPNYFQFYGNTYYYMNVPGFDGLQEGRMNARVYKYTSKTVSAFANQVATDFNMEVIYRMSLFNGANLCGDNWAGICGGLEIVSTRETSSITGIPIDIYIQPDQTKWHSETNSIIQIGQTFGFEALYEKVIHTTNLGDSFTRTREGYTPFKTAKASVIAQGECYLQVDYGSNWGNVGQRARIWPIFRSDSLNNTGASPRNLNLIWNYSSQYQYSLGTSQALVEL